MAWVKVPVENHRLFHAALSKDPRISTVQMFGSVVALVNGNMFGGLFERSAIVKLGEADYAEAMKLDGADKFDPMRTGRVMSNTVVLPETVMDEPGELRDWLRKAFEYTATLPPKKKKGAKAKGAKAKGAKAKGAKAKGAKAKGTKANGAKAKGTSKTSTPKKSGANRKTGKPTRALNLASATKRTKTMKSGKRTKRTARG